MKTIFAIFFAWLACGDLTLNAHGENPKPAGDPADAEALDPKWRGLIGEWSGEGGGSPGPGSGGSSFQFDLGQHVIIRRNHANYPASAGRAATAHEDLMVIYPDAGGAGAKAIYFDNEGHVIEYVATWATDGKSLSLVSMPTPLKPGFRLVYTELARDQMDLTFEIAPPGRPGEFKRYLSGRLARKSGG
jgi:hypothetical protein